MSAQSLLRRVTLDSLLNLARRWWSLGVGLLISVVVVRGLGVEGRGIYALALLFPTTLNMLLNAGLTPAVVYFIAQEPDNLAAHARQFSALSLWVSAFGVGLGALAAVFARQTLLEGLDLALALLCLPVLVVMIVYQNFLAIFQGLHNFRLYNLFELVSQLFLLALTVLGVWVLRWGVVGALLAIITSRLLTIGLQLYYLHQQTPERPLLGWRVARTSLAPIASYWLRGYFSRLASFLNYRADIFLLTLLGRGTASIAFYDVAVTIAEKLWTVSHAVGLVLFPRVAALQQDEAARNALVLTVARYVLWLSSGVGALLGVLSEWLMVLLYGEAFAPAGVTLRFLMLGIVTWTAASVFINAFAGMGQPERNTRVLAVGIGVNVLLNAWLIPQHDIVGAALATSVSYTLVMAILLVQFARGAGAAWHALFLPTRQDWRLWQRAWQGLRRRMGR